VHPPGELIDKAFELARDLASRVAPVSAAVIRRALFHNSGAPSPGPAFELDSRLIGAAGLNPDTAEGIRSFFERRPAAFPGTVPRDLPDNLPWD
jgi:enoyl-CoA hydratase/carnithine racemase